VWMMTSSALVFLMIPGTALFSSGISGRQSALSMMFLPMLTAAIIGLQVYLLSYERVHDLTKQVVALGILNSFLSFDQCILGR